MDEGSGWFVGESGRQQGPLTTTQVQALIAAGKITGSALVWREGMANWAPISSAFSSAPPPLSGNQVSSVAAPNAQTGGLPKKKRGCLFAFLALLGLFTIAVVIAAISDTAPRRSSEASSIPRTASATENLSSVATCALGQPFTLGKFRYTISERATLQSIGNNFIQRQPQPGATFLIVTYTIENVGNETETALSSDFYLLDHLGRKFRTSSHAETALAMSSNGQKDLILSELQPGVSKTTQQVFELPLQSVQTKGLKLMVPEKGFLGRKEIAVPLN